MRGNLEASVALAAVHLMAGERGRLSWRYSALEATDPLVWSHAILSCGVACTSSFYDFPGC